MNPVSPLEPEDRPVDVDPPDLPIWKPSHHDIAVRAYENWKGEFGDHDTIEEVTVHIWLHAQWQLIEEWNHRHHDH